MSTQMDRIEQMLRALCTHLGVRDATTLVATGADTVASDDTRYAGVVSRFEHGWGFIECEAMNRNFFVHFSDIEGTGLRSLEAGGAVSFEIAPGKDGRPKAVRVRRQGGRATARVPRIEAIPRSARASQNGDRGLPADDDLDEAAQVESLNGQ